MKEKTTNALVPLGIGIGIGVCGIWAAVELLPLLAVGGATAMIIYGISKNNSGD